MQAILLTLFKGPMLSLFGSMLNLAAARAKSKTTQIKDPKVKDATNTAIDGFMVEIVKAASEAGK
jgi:hypothetical protein